MPTYTEMPRSTQHTRAGSAKLLGMDDQFEGYCLCGATVSIFVGFERDAYVVTQGLHHQFD
jgi:hypothetical protein